MTDKHSRRANLQELEDAFVKVSFGEEDADTTSDPEVLDPAFVPWHDQAGAKWPNQLGFGCVFIQFFGVGTSTK